MAAQIIWFWKYSMRNVWVHIEMSVFWWQTLVSWQICAQFEISSETLEEKREITGFFSQEKNQRRKQIYIFILSKGSNWDTKQISVGIFLSFEEMCKSASHGHTCTTQLCVLQGLVLSRLCGWSILWVCLQPPGEFTVFPQILVSVLHYKQPSFKTFGMFLWSQFI